MALSMEKLERIFSPSRKKDKPAVESLPVITPQLQSPSKPLFPSPSFIRPTSNSMKPREEERRLRNPDDRERAFSISSQGRTHSRQPSNSSSTTRGGQRHVDQSTTAAAPCLDSPCSISPFKFPEDSIFRHEPSRRYSMQNTQTISLMEQVDEELANVPGDDVSSLVNTSPTRRIGARPVSSGLFRPVVFDQRPESLRLPINKGCPAALLPSPIIIPSPISPSMAAGALSMLESLPPSPTRNTSTEKDLCLPILPRLNRFSTLNLPHLESPSGSDSEDEGPRYGQHPSPASLATPNTFSTRESFDSLTHSLASSFSSKREARETWCARADDPFSNKTAHVTDGPEQAILVRDSFASWPSDPNQERIIEILWEPSVDEFMALSDDEVAESYDTYAAEDLPRRPTPPPKDTPKMSHRSITFVHGAGIQKSASVRTVRADHDRKVTQTSGKPLSQGQASSPTAKTAPIRASTLISTIATTFGFDEIYIMSFWPDDRKRRGRLLDFPMHFENARYSRASRRNSKSKVTGRLLASYGIEGATGSWELPTDILAEALDTEETCLPRRTRSIAASSLRHSTPKASPSSLAAPSPTATYF
ncbi:uncharacterized protein B0I36DRAFT_326931 [Microdochium trichocladiopsis]|uniref:Uncharacterized protein n=1 Tax=Microdochium trichocladiopsis TaxID=1682393 RepID=A0A9P9BKT0_9PEZI|nr:uncharacterized protein B0I36DRAFT_326931 [Microdochium trichocladiopsis]KAH7027352.1 hypothetical protein B0I36DRAFT_326931 [Microdochium trichocladiopsis]